MKKLLAIIGISVIFFFIYFLQVNFFNWFTIAGIKPNLFVIYLVILSLFMGKNKGIIFGIFFGLYLDIINGRILGISSILLAIIAFFSEVMNKNVSNDTKITMILIITISTGIYEVGYYIASIWKLSINIEILQFIKIVCIEIFFNGLLTIILYPVIQKFGSYLSEIFNKRNVMGTYF